jgi:hypothetical protein
VTPPTAAVRARLAQARLAIVTRRRKLVAHHLFERGLIDTGVRTTRARTRSSPNPNHRIDIYESIDPAGGAS